MEWWDSILDAVTDVSDTAGGIYNDWTSNTGNTTSTQKPNANDTGNTYPQTVQPASVPVWAYGVGGLLLVLVIVIALKGGK